MANEGKTIACGEYRREDHNHILYTPSKRSIQWIIGDQLGSSVAIVLILEGEHIDLRPLKEEDFEDFCVWYNDEQVTRYLGMKPLSRDKAKLEFNQLLNDQNGVYFGIIKKDEGRIIGYVFLTDILESHMVAQEFGIVIGDRNLWGHGYGSEATKIVLKYGFKHLKLHRIQLKVLDFNKRAQHVYRKLGFAEEGSQREARLVDGKWHNVLLMGMLKKEFES